MRCVDGSALALERRGLLSAHHVSVDGSGWVDALSKGTPQLALTHSPQPIELSRSVPKRLRDLLLKLSLGQGGWRMIVRKGKVEIGNSG